MSPAPDTPADRARATLRAAEAAAEAARGPAARNGAIRPHEEAASEPPRPSAPPLDPAARREQLLDLADELGFQTAEARRRLNELDAALDRLAGRGER